MPADRPPQLNSHTYMFAYMCEYLSRLNCTNRVILKIDIRQLFSHPIGFVCMFVCMQVDIKYALTCMCVSRKMAFAVVQTRLSYRLLLKFFYLFACS